MVSPRTTILLKSVTLMTTTKWDFPLPNPSPQGGGAFGRAGDLPFFPRGDDGPKDRMRGRHGRSCPSLAAQDIRRLHSSSPSYALPGIFSPLGRRWSFI
jgi:hypothetical protein